MGGGGRKGGVVEDGVDHRYGLCCRWGARKGGLATTGGASVCRVNDDDLGCVQEPARWPSRPQRKHAISARAEGTAGLDDAGTLEHRLRTP